MKQIATALLKAQSEMSNPKKGATNPFFKSKYADLNAIREAVIPTLNANGISVLQPISHIEGKNFVKTILLHESGELMESLTEIIYNKQNDAQAQGSGISYARRYALQSFVCVGADDDDGNKASQPTAQKSQVAEKPHATKEIMDTAKKQNYSIAQIRTKYFVDQDLEHYFLTL
jgi:hypothetical protein